MIQTYISIGLTLMAAINVWMAWKNGKQAKQNVADAEELVRLCRALRQNGERLDLAYDGVLTAEWLKHYVSTEGLCVLCGNTGLVGEHNCFCPNGRELGLISTPAAASPPSTPQAD